MEIINFLIFIGLAGTIILSALLAVFSPKIVYCVLGATISFLSVAGIFFMLNADFVGIAQIFIYGIGVSILLAFAIMFTDKEKEKKLYLSNPVRIFLGFVAVLVLFLSMACFVAPSLNNSPGVFRIKEPTIRQVRMLQTKGTTKAIGKRLFCDYVLPFELLSLLLLAGIVGVGYFAGKEE